LTNFGAVEGTTIRAKSNENCGNFCQRDGEFTKIRRGLSVRKVFNGAERINPWETDGCASMNFRTESSIVEMVFPAGSYSSRDSAEIYSPSLLQRQPSGWHPGIMQVPTGAGVRAINFRKASPSLYIRLDV
jgi:hypothetical protein